MRQLTREQRKIIYLGAAALSCLLLFWLVIYAPQSRRLSAIKNKLKDVEAEIAQINRITEGRELAAAVKDLNNQLRKAGAKLPLRIEDVVKSLSEEARRQTLEVKNINFSDRRPLKFEIPGFSVDELVISMNLSCEFRELGEYLYSLRNNFPALVRVRQLSIKGKGEGYINLDAGLEVLAYLAKEKP